MKFNYCLVSPIFWALAVWISSTASSEFSFAGDFEKLLVYQKSVDFAEAVCTSTEQFQRG